MWSEVLCFAGRGCRVGRAREDLGALHLSLTQPGLLQNAERIGVRALTIPAQLGCHASCSGFDHKLAHLKGLNCDTACMREYSVPT